MKVATLIVAVLLLMAALALAFPVGGQGAEVRYKWVTTQVTDTGVSERTPRVYNGALVWRSWGARMIETWVDGVRTTVADVREADPILHLSAPAIHSGGIVWREYSQAEEMERIYLYDGESVTMIDSYPVGMVGEAYVVEPKDNFPPTYHCLNPSICNGKIAYPKWDGNDYEIVVWENGVTTWLTNDDVDELEPSICPQGVTYVHWLRDESTSQDVYYYDFATSSEEVVSATIYDDQDPHTDGTFVVYAAWNFDDSDKKSDIFAWNPADGGIANISDKVGSDYEPQIGSGFIVWHGQDAPGDDFDVYVYDGVSVTALANSPDNEQHAWASGDTVVWMKSDGVQFDIYMAKRVAVGTAIVPQIMLLLN